MSLIGAHISAAGGVHNAPARAKTQGCEVMQIFVQNPQQYAVPKTTPAEVAAFRAACKKNKISEIYVHAPYLINLASENNRTRYGSINLIRKNLERASALGCAYLMTHLGSYGTASKKAGLTTVIKSLQKILDGYTGSCQLLLELSAGSGAIIGSRFEEMQTILSALTPQKVGICLDTAHIFTSGYNLSSPKAVNETVTQFDKIIGLKKLKLIHLNDSTAPLASRKDRHADIGEGLIGVENLKYIFNHKKLRKINFVLETPGTEMRRKKDIALFKKSRA